MASRFTFNASTPSPNAALGLLPWASAKVLDVCRPSRVTIDVVAAAFDVSNNPPYMAIAPAYGNAAQNALDSANVHPCFSGTRSGLTFEGPFLCYEIARGSISDAMLGIRKGDHQPIVKGQFEASDNPFRFYFDLQAKRPLWLPYPGSLTVISQYWGSWSLNVISYELVSVAEFPSHLDCEVPLTMVLNQAAGGGVASSRTFNAVPPGAHSFTYRDTGMAAANPTIQLFQEDQPGHRAVAANGIPFATDIPIPLTAAMGGSSFYGRLGIGNAKALKISGAGNGSQGVITWHVSLF